MTQPNGNRRTVAVNGRDIRIKQLTDLQQLHLLRHARILQKDDIDQEQKLESADRMFAILGAIVADPDDRAYLIQMEEEGMIELRDLLGFVTPSNDEAEPEQPKVRRGPGRPRKSVA